MNRISKENYYLNIAQTVLERATCLRRVYGAIIVKNDEIISTGYNGSPRGRKNCVDMGFCTREAMQVPRGERYELCRSVHAEANAIISASRRDMVGGTLYLVGRNAQTGELLTDATSCPMCRRMVINAGLARVVIRRTPEEFTVVDVEEWVRTDDLAIGRSAAVGENGMVRASNALRSHLRSNERETEDRDYVERCFGRSLYAPKELALMEQRDCTGNHLGCHLWFTRGEPSPDKPVSADAQRLFQQAEEQAKRNRAAYVKNSDLYQSALLRLTEQIHNCMLIHQQPDAVSARQGHLDSRRVWRLPVLGDDKVFLRSDEESAPGFTVDLLLDGSASRLHCQETIAAQGYILAKSLADCGIPVRVSSFCSLRGYTVLRVLKDFGEKNGERKIFDYFAAGWNRDGLALRMAAELLDTAPADKHLLILLTDASPDDSHKILPTGKVPLSRDYDGQVGVEDTADEVRALRRKGIRVAAVFMGENANVPNARAIYGQDLAPIRRMDQLSAAAGRLIQTEIRELSG